MNRKWIALLLSCVLVLSLAAACGRNKTNANDSNNVNDGVNNNTGNNTNGNDNVNTPGNMTPGNELNNGVDNNGTLNNNNMNGNTNSGLANFPNTLITGAEVAVTDLFDTLGLAVTDLENAMRDVTNVGENGNYAYRHNLLGQESEVSYGFDQQNAINKVTVKAPAGTADEWRNELTGTLGAQEVQGEMNSWTYNENNVKITDEGDHVLITIEKKAQ